LTDKAFPLIPQPLFPQRGEGEQETCKGFESPSPALGYRIYTSQYSLSGQKPIFLEARRFQKNGFLPTPDSFSETLDFACATRTQNQGFQKNCPE